MLILSFVLDCFNFYDSFGRKDSSDSSEYNNNLDEMAKLISLT